MQETAWKLNTEEPTIVPPVVTKMASQMERSTVMVPTAGRLPLDVMRRGAQRSTGGTASTTTPTTRIARTGMPAGHKATIRSIRSAPSVRFVQMARAAADVARSLGLRAPDFMSPPHLKGVDRTIRRDRAKNLSADSCVVAIRTKGRPLAAVQADIIEGVIVTNNLTATAAVQVRTELWSHLTTLADDD